MDAPGRTFISFATAPGRVASDGAGRSSPYTKHLLQSLKQRNMPIERVFKVVRRNVMDETKGEQIPCENSRLAWNFFYDTKMSEGIFGLSSRDALASLASNHRVHVCRTSSLNSLID
jgi:hypothetical protein